MKLKKHIKSESNEVNISSILPSTITIDNLNVTGKQYVANAIRMCYKNKVLINARK